MICITRAARAHLRWTPMTQPPDTARSATTPTSILVIDDHDLLRLGLRTLVQSHAAQMGRIVRVLEARNLHDGLALYADHAPAIGLVLLDLHLPDAHGLSALVSVLARFPAARVAVLSGVNDPALVRQALAMGAQAYLLKAGNLDHVIAYLRSVWRAETDTPPAPLQAAPNALSSALRDAYGQPVVLSARQTQMLEWVLAGQSNREIAAGAGLSEGTVKNHVSTLLLLFGVRSRAQLISRLR